MRASPRLSIQSFWGGTGLSKSTFAERLRKLLFGKAPLRSTCQTKVIDIQSDPNFALHVLQKISLESATKARDNRLDAHINRDFITKLSQNGSYFLSQIVHDIDKLRKVDWTVELDPFWRDQAANHRSLYSFLYDAKSREAEVLNFALNYFENMVQCAFQTEAAYSRIFYAKFHMQRGVRDPIEREKILLGCAESFEKFKKTIAKEHATKAVKELHWQLMGIRHWVWDCPNAKRIYSRILA
ncbi:succinate dehydrogenase subunit [Perkinsela sp. CCAP 1560/4]|nr:succinate dehydrogenase subunit [Perkinsela sp. CCAP 1560/4]|eukprot:KNH08026.1 succinate dehydrogenase subunit [Perkinsela sp. CCAP 1560/4]